MICNYRFCRGNIPQNENGNRRYCNDDCYMFEKLQRSRENYAVNKNSLNQIKHFEKILSVFYKKYGSEIFDVFKIRVEQMNWSIITGTTVIDGENYRVLGGYAYILYSNKTIKIIKHDSKSI